MKSQLLTACLFVCLTTASVGANSNACADIQAELRTIDGAIDVYVAQYGRLPPRQGWLSLLKSGNILRNSFPERDKWGHPFFYAPSERGDYDLRSLGADGQWGTEDDQIKADGWKWRLCSSPSRC